MKNYLLKSFLVKQTEKLIFAQVKAQESKTCTKSNNQKLINKSLFLTILLFIAFNFSSQAQDKIQKGLQQVKESTNFSELEKISSKSKQNRTDAFKIAQEKGWKTKLVDKNGNVSVLQRVYKLGKSYLPVYNSVKNSGGTNGGSVVNKTSALWPGGELGLSLTGSGLTVAIWDGGPSRNTHQEFGSRVTLKETGTFGDHATHVTGTIGATGVDAAAKGMAYGVSIHSYSFYDGDDEIATYAGNYLVSNHSYGSVCGWAYGNGYFGGGSSDWEWVGDNSQFACYMFGWYSPDAADWDEIAYNAPYYLILKAAGNDHNFSPYFYNFPSTTKYYYDGGNGTIGTSTSPVKDKQDSFDNISTAATAKNILTIGNVDYEDMNNIIISSSSSWGGTDDGRIKPDISTKGTDVYSSIATSNSAYDTYTGTSMATPMTTGSLILLQQHYNNLHSQFMRSATLKALVIHAADEAGNYEGPDYVFGWGLLNTKEAAIAISNNDNSYFIGEQTLNNGGTFTKDITASGTKPLKVTIVWTDVKGNAIATTTDEVHNNRTKMLINDLDLRISNGTSTYYPYKLDILHPANAATKADNNTDNVEQVYIANPGSGNYTVTVNHKGSLTNSNQNFSIIISGLTGTPVVVDDCANTVSSFPYNESFESSFGLWQQSSADNFDWARDSGGTPSGSTGPSVASNGTYYVYAEASSPNYPSKTTVLTSPCFDLTAVDNASFNFDYHMYGTSMGSLSVELSADAGQNWASVWSKSGNLGDVWNSQSIDLSAYSGETVMLRFVGITGSSYTGDMAFDNISVTTGTVEPPVGDDCDNTVSTFPYAESFESGTGVWLQDTNDDTDWTRDSGGTPSSSTGPSTATAGSYYMYIESSSPNYPSKTAALNGPCFDLSAEDAASFSFDYHMYGTSMGTLALQAKTAGGEWATIWSKSGNLGNTWFSQAIDLDSYIGETVQLRFLGTTGSSYTSDMAIDNVKLTTEGEVTPPVGTCTDVTLTITFDNYPEETSWTLKDDAGATIASGGTYASQADGSTITKTVCLNDGCYSFTINDTYGDGICCSYGNGSYKLMNGAETLAAGGSFTSSETTNFCLSGGVKVSSFTNQTFMDVNSQELSFKDFKIYPNPVCDILNIQARELSENTLIRIIDMSGAQQLEISGSKAANGINISNLKSGMYIIELQTKKEVFQKTFIKE
ncbi:MAG: S8 family serine peptidase [Bacteroidales bacterium]|nr:S8 family serine peptidase [Bacteroidales bacterium]